jgi:hypothetical protein
MGTLRTDEKNLVTGETITAAVTAIGDPIDCKNADDLTLFVNYTNGDEDSFAIIIFWSTKSGGTPAQEATWSTIATRAATQHTYNIGTASIVLPIRLDVSHLTEVVVKGDATGGTPTGTVTIDYILARKD